MDFILAPRLDSYPSEYYYITEKFRKLGFIFPILLIISLIETLLLNINIYIEISLLVSYLLLTHEYFLLKETNNHFNLKFYILRQILNILSSIYPMVYLIENIDKSFSVYIIIFLAPIIIHNLCILYCLLLFIYNKITTEKEEMLYIDV